MNLTKNIDTTDTNTCPVAHKRMEKIQVYVSPKNLDIAKALAEAEDKPLGTVNREIWERGLYHYATEKDVLHKTQYSEVGAQKISK